MSSSTVSVSAVTPTQHPFQKKVDEIKPSKTDINFVVMDYLISEGYPRAAEKFAKEANIQLPLEEESIQSRVDIRRAIHAGDIDAAINKINDLNPQILDTDPALHFALLRLQLIELIRSCTASAASDITPALNFASSQLAPRAATNPEFLKDLELTMSLLIFLPATGGLQPQLAELLEPSLMGTAYKYTKSNGVPLEFSNPYKARDAVCPATKGTTVKTLDYAQLNPKDTASMMNVLDAGYSLSIALKSGTYDFMYYNGGILDDPYDCSDNTVDHAVVIVGYDTSGGTPYWIVRNTWGTDWGESGYVRIKRGINYCNMEMFPFFVESN